MKLFAPIAQLVRRLPDSAKRALRTALFTFAGTFTLALIGFLNDAQSWMATGSRFPSVAVLAKAIMAGLASGGAGLVSYIINKLEDAGYVPALFAASKPDAPT